MAPVLAFTAVICHDGGAEVCVTTYSVERSAETWEVANVVVFLASDYSSYMTGEIVSVSSQHP